MIAISTIISKLIVPVSVFLLFLGLFIVSLVKFSDMDGTNVFVSFAFVICFLGFTFSAMWIDERISDMVFKRRDPKR